MGEIVRLAQLLRGRTVRAVTAFTILWWGFVVAPPARADDAVLVGAGDIAVCTNKGAAITAGLLKSIPGTVFTLGDNAYKQGTAKQYKSCYGPTWGKFKDRTKPAAGNHDFETKGASGYFGYFGSAAGPKGKGWYSYDAGAWHVVVLDSNCDQVGCAKGSEQERWLRADLAAHEDQCTVAYWHHSRFASDKEHGNTPAVGPFWDALYDFGAELVVSGHSHVYERFAPQTPSGKADPAYGIQEIVVGTGGDSHYKLGSAKPNSLVRNASTLGVLKLTLHDGSYDWNFVPQPGKKFTDSGSGTCHGAPVATDPPTTTTTSSTTTTTSPPDTTSTTETTIPDIGPVTDGTSPAA